jgi:hypothetical protein
MNTGEIAQAHGAKPLISHPADKNRMRSGDRHPLKAQRFLGRQRSLGPDTDQAAKLHRDKRTDYDIVGDEDRP